ncbi:MAG: phosphoserine phosphatase SerB [Euryarchaeota archaeon]|nr:phosphoserine phosphatase SerB [Euryarchaeota archaeon]
MDGTLVDAETIDELAKAANVGDLVASLTKRAMRGEIDFEDALRERVRLLKGLKVEEVNRVALNIPLMKGATELIKELKKEYKVAMVSGGFTIVATEVARKLGVDYTVANELITKNGFLTGEVVGPLVRQNSKSGALQEIARQEGIHTEDCIVIGDGANDISMFEAAGFSIAFNANPILYDIADVIITKKDLTLVLPILQGGAYAKRIAGKKSTA